MTASGSLMSNYLNLNYFGDKITVQCFVPLPEPNTHFLRFQIMDYYFEFRLLLQDKDFYIKLRVVLLYHLRWQVIN